METYSEKREKGKSVYYHLYQERIQIPEEKLCQEAKADQGGHKEI